MSKKPSNSQQYLDGGIRIAVHHQQLLDELIRKEADQEEKLSRAIGTSSELLLSLGHEISQPNQPNPGGRQVQSVVTAKDWDEILAEAQQATPEHVDFDMLLTEQELGAVVAKHDGIGNDLSWFSSLDRFDVAISVAGGVIAGVIDVLLVGIPAHAGFGGSPSSKGGWLSNAIKEKVGAIFPPDKIGALEKAYGVPFDPSTNNGLLKHVSGLGPRSHRFQSLGHDPLLGFVFGVRDILTGEFSAISKDGHLIVQNVGNTLDGGVLIVRILEAMKRTLGHLASDVATPAGLPAPLMPLLSFLQFGKIGNHEHTIAEVARAMYGKGYDFRHFMASSIPVMVTEVIVRLGYVIRQLRAGKKLTEAVPTASSLTLRRQLLIAHSVATLVNAGKVYVTQNPLSISWPQVLAFLRYVLPEVAFVLHGKEATRAKMVEDEMLKDYRNITIDVDRLLGADSGIVIKL